jgi:hypothetical protein
MSAGKYASMQSFKEEVSFLIDRSEINQALHLIHDFVERIVTEPLCTSQVLGSKTLDELCRRIGKTSFARIDQVFTKAVLSQESPPVFVYIVTKVQKSGGHSRVIEDFINAQPGGRHVILSTELSGSSDTGYLMKWLASQAGITFEQAPKQSFEQRLTWLQKRLLETHPKRVYLFNHHQDSVAVAAIQPEMKLDASFYHHGDHHLCLGVHLDHLTHVDLHPMGYHYCRDELGVDNRYLPLTFEDKHFVPVQTEFASGGCLTTATAARSNKIEIPYYVSYLDTIPRVLKATGGRHIHIGKLTPWALRRMRAQMRKNGVPEDRLIYIEWTPSVWKSLQEHAVDVYIASFPYGAGLTLIEALGAGVPVIMHQHMISRVLSGLELAYPEAFRWADPEDLLAHLTALEPDRLKREKRLSRQRYETFHRPEILQAYLLAPDSIQLPIPPLISEFRPRYDEWAAWAESQLSFSRLVYRLSYRTFRRLRSFFANMSLR